MAHLPTLSRGSAAEDTVLRILLLTALQTTDRHFTAGKRRLRGVVACTNAVQVSVTYTSKE